MLTTPRRVLAEIKKAEQKPWWVGRLFDDVMRHLTLTTFRGQPLLDTPMTAEAIEAVIDEAVDVVRKPMTGAQLAAEMDAIMQRVRQ